MGRNHRLVSLKYRSKTYFQSCIWMEVCSSLMLILKNYNLCTLNSIPIGNVALAGTSHLRLFSNWIVPKSATGPLICRCGLISSQAEGLGVFQQPSWQYQQVRTRKRGTEYQPKNIKRKRTHGWIKRLSTRSGIEVLLRRMLKGRKSLSHWKILHERLMPNLHRIWNERNLNFWLTVHTGWNW